MKKKTKVIIVITIIIIITMWLIIFCIDYYRCANLKEPIFVIAKTKFSIYISDGSETFTYYCLGYRVVLGKKNISEYKTQVNSVEMYIFNKRIVDLKK